jgi:hypothetical protein
MDFLNPKRERRNRIMLLLGYALIAMAIGIATLVLLYQSYGYGIDKKGKVTQNGLVFVSSQPRNSSIYLNGVRYSANTNTRMNLAAGSYNMQISADGYRGWQRPIVIAGGDVQHYDYPFLFPKDLATTTLLNLATDPSFTTQSPDKRWLLLDEADNVGKFMEYDLKTSGKPVQSELSLPAGSYTPADGAQTWSVVEWASDNRHVVLLHSFSDGTKSAHEYILFDRDTPVDSINLTSTLKLSESQAVSLFDKKVNQFYVYDSADQTLKDISASDAAVISQLDNVLAYKTYGNDRLLYVTDKSVTGKAATNQISAVLQIGSKITTLRNLSAGATNYVLDLAQYSGDWYVAVGADNDSSVYLYKNPQSQTAEDANRLPLPWRRLLVPHPTYVSFSSNTQFVVAESGQQFAVYDAENVAMYRYTATQPLDQPQTHAAWMDGNRLMYISGGKLTVFDYDYRNQQVLQAISPAYVPSFAPDYSYSYAVGTGSGGSKSALTSTALTTPPK